MSAIGRIAFLLAGCGWSLVVLAQQVDCAQEEKQVAAQPPLSVAAFLVLKDCLGGKNDAAPVAKSLLRLVATDKPKDTGQDKQKKSAEQIDQEKKSAEQELGETPQILERAFGELASYLAESIQALPADDSAREARRALSQLAGEVEAVRKSVAQRLPLAARDTKGWEWDGKGFRGLSAVDLSGLNKDCQQAGDGCSRSREAAKIALRTGKLANRALAFDDAKTYQEALAAARLRDAKWTGYFEDARLQLPLELLFNGWLHGRANRAAGGFADVPSYQWILLHPEIGMEYVRGAQAGNRFQPSLVIEVIGYNRWSWSKEGKVENALGASFIATYSDRAGISSARPGVMLHVQNKYSLAYTRNSGKNGFILSVDLAKLVTKVDDKARSDFRLNGTGRAGD